MTQFFSEKFHATFVGTKNDMVFYSNSINHGSISPENSDGMI
jgi:hypothetical protein